MRGLLRFPYRAAVRLAGWLNEPSNRALVDGQLLLAGGAGLDGLTFRQQLNVAYAFLWADTDRTKQGIEERKELEALHRLRPLEQDDDGSLPDELVGVVAPDWWNEAESTPLESLHDVAVRQAGEA